jgi:hypothetical protein
MRYEDKLVERLANDPRLDKIVKNVKQSPQYQKSTNKTVRQRMINDAIKRYDRRKAHNERFKDINDKYYNEALYKPATAIPGEALYVASNTISNKVNENIKGKHTKESYIKRKRKNGKYSKNFFYRMRQQNKDIARRNKLLRLVGNKKAKAISYASDIATSMNPNDDVLKNAGDTVNNAKNKNIKGTIKSAAKTVGCTAKDTYLLNIPNAIAKKAGSKLAEKRKNKKAKNEGYLDALLDYNCITLEEYQFLEGYLDAIVDLQTKEAL